MSKTVSFTKDSTNVFFHILTACNLSCRHCYINPEQHGKNTLDASVIRSWLDLFVRDSPKANLILLGGEPTLHPKLDQVVHDAKDLGYHSITIDTNGYLFHDILSKVTPEDVNFFSFSLDGASPQTNDPIRGKGSYRACIEGIRKAVCQGFQTSLIYTVSRDNLLEIENMPSLLKELEIHRFFIQVIGLRGESAGNGKESKQVSRSEWLDVIPNVAKQVAQTGILVVYPKVFLEKDESFECAGLVANNYFVFPNGRVYRCPLCEDYPLHSLEIKENRWVSAKHIHEADLFQLTIPEGCVMNKLIQPYNLEYKTNGAPLYRIACCMLKEEL